MTHRFPHLAIALSVFACMAASTLAQDNRLPDRQPGARVDVQVDAQRNQPMDPRLPQPGQPMQPGVYGQPYTSNSNYGQPGMIAQVGYSQCGCDSGQMMVSYSGNYGGGNDNCCCRHHHRHRRCCR